MGDEWRNARTVRVGGADIPASEAEHTIASLPNGTPIEWGGGKPTGGPFFGGELASGVGVLLYSWWYDGVIAEVQAGGKRFPLFPSHSKDFWSSRWPTCPASKGRA